MEIYNLGWNFNSLKRVYISSWLNSKLLFKMTLQLHVKISNRYAGWKFQFGLANPRWKFQIFHIIDIFFKPVWKFDTTHVWIPCLFFWKIKIDCSHLGFNLFFPRFRFSLLTFIKFSIYLRLLYFNPGWNFLCNCNFFQLGLPTWNCNPEWKSSYNHPFIAFVPYKYNNESKVLLTWREER